MAPSWIDEARQKLLKLRRKPGVWAYRPGNSPAIEPTAISALALLSSDREVAQAAGRWLAAVQKNDGSLGVTDHLLEPGWPTPFACMLWAGLDEFAMERKSAVRWLLNTKGRANPRVENDPMGHNPGLIGWPWNAGTHSWVEPTAAALMVLARDGKQSNGRAIEGEKLLRDRIIPGGGWNMGNPIVFSTVLRAIPAPTGLGLLAFAAMATPRNIAESSIDYLCKCLPTTRAPMALGWGLLGLRAWDAHPENAASLLEESYQLAIRRTANPLDLALLILAAEPQSLAALGIPVRRKETAHEGLLTP